MARIDIGGIRLNALVWGEGETTVVCIHGNLASADWFTLAAPLVPARFRLVAIDWRGCGGSDKPDPGPDFADYAIERHAADIRAAIRALGIGRCHLATHSTGGLIALHMLVAEPDRFDRVLGLAPVGPRGLRFGPEGHAMIAAMRASADATRKGLALVAASLFEPESLVPGGTPAFAAHATAAQRALFERLVAQTRTASDGIWFGTPRHLEAARDRAEALIARLPALRHPHRLLWGSLDPFIPRRDLEEMAALMPDCRLEIAAGVGHAMTIERPELYARHLAEFL